MEPILLAGVLAGAMVLGGVGVALATDRPHLERFGEVRAVREDRQVLRRPNAMAAFMDRAGRVLAPTVSGLLGPIRMEDLDGLLDAAGRPGGVSAERFAGRKGAYTILMGGAGLLFALNGGWFLPVVLPVVGFFLPDIAVRSLASERQEEIERNLPDFLDVLAVTVSAGLDFRTALGRVCDAYPGPLSEEVRTALQQMQLGETRREALGALARRNRSESLSSFVTALNQAEDLGAPLTSALADIAADIRHAYAQHARRQAAKAEPRLSVILTLTLIPAALIIVAVGFFLTAGVDLGGLLGG